MSAGQPAWRRQLVAYSFIGPNLIGFFLFTAFPVVFTLLLAFTNWTFSRNVWEFDFVGLQNFAKLIRDPWFRDAIRNSFVFTASVVPSSIIIALVLAVVVERYVLAGRKLIRLFMYLPYVTSMVVAAYVWQMMLSRRGFITQIIAALGVREIPIWLGDPKWALWVIVVLTVWKTVGYVFVLYTAGLQGIPEELYEAATMDGAPEITKFFRITIPMLSPITFFIVVTQLIFTFRAFEQVLILTDGGPGTATTLLGHQAFVNAFRFYRMGYASAITWVLLVIIFLITLIQWRGQKRWVHT